jgi:single-strand DNA-binding protein
MARSVNKVILLGNLGRDAELTYTPSGQALCKVGLATSRRWQDKSSGEWQEETEWHNLVIWGKTAENLTQYLTKGKTIFVEGRIKSRNWEKDGVKHYATDIVVDEVVLVGSRSDSGAGGEGGGAARPRPAAAARPAARSGGPGGQPAAQMTDSGPSEDISEDDIPF